MAVTAAPARPVTERRDRVVRHAEVVGVWAVDCVCAHRADTDWAAELLGDTEHRHEHATLEEEGYHVDSFGVERVAHQRGTAYVRLVCSVSIKPTRLSPTIAARHRDDRHVLVRPPALVRRARHLQPADLLPRCIEVDRAEDRGGRHGCAAILGDC